LILFIVLPLFFPSFVSSLPLIYLSVFIYA
jgi:hypothetical protein